MKNAREAFKANLPIFQVKVRGNVVADAEDFTSKTGTMYQSFRVAYNAKKDGDAIFFRVLLEDGGEDIGKGDYVQVVGDYSEQTNVSTYLNRTIFAEKVQVLGKAERGAKSSGKAEGGKAKSKGAEANDDIPF